MITLANQRDDDWPISKYQETPAASQPLPTPCLCSKLINPAVNLGSGLLCYSTVLDVTGALARVAVNPFMPLHCCGRLILSVLGTQTLGITFGGSSGIPLTGKNNILPVEGVSSLGGEISEHRC